MFCVDYMEKIFQNSSQNDESVLEIKTEKPEDLRTILQSNLSSLNTFHGDNIFSYYCKYNIHSLNQLDENFTLAQEKISSQDEENVPETSKEISNTWFDSNVQNCSDFQMDENIEVGYEKIQTVSESSSTSEESVLYTGSE